ncbi:hypothetical protein WA577_002522, partial [Blastocystis sp. JDR]
MATTPEDDAFLKSDEVLPPTPDARQQVQNQQEELSSRCKAAGIDVLPLLRVMKKREVRTMSYHPEMDYTLFFDTVHTILSSMAERYKLPLQTKLAALSYFCRFVEKVPIDCRRVNAYALMCMVIAMRYEECTDSLPSLDE